VKNRGYVPGFIKYFVFVIAAGALIFAVIEFFAPQALDIFKQQMDDYKKGGEISCPAPQDVIKEMFSSKP